MMERKVVRPTSIGCGFCFLVCAALVFSWSDAFQRAVQTPIASTLKRRKMQLQASSSLSNVAQGNLILGVNKYSHDASVCIVDSDTGDILFSQAKERITGRKHDGGSTASLVNYALQSIGARKSDIHTVVSNNHHFRVQPFEKRIEMYKKLNYVPADYISDSLFLPRAQQFELSHHLAHAWSVVGCSPFETGVVVVMDGMGEQYKAMMEDMSGAEEDSGDYMHDIKLLKTYGVERFTGQPISLLPGSSYREAESAYVFDKTSVRPVFKRWARERSPPELYNHGFENMESMGAVYSRISSHVLGDWNACGKIMGLAQWADRKRTEAADWYYPPSSKSDNNEGSSSTLETLDIGEKFFHKMQFMTGNPLTGTFSVDWKLLDGLQHCNSNSADENFAGNFGFYSNLAQSVQGNLEDCALDMLRRVKDLTGESNLALAGGVALNSVLNGRVLRELPYDQVYVPPAPGDEGIAVGCALYGLQRYREEKALKEKEMRSKTATKITTATITSSSSTSDSGTPVIDLSSLATDLATNGNKSSSSSGSGIVGADAEDVPAASDIFSYPRRNVDALLSMSPEQYSLESPTAVAAGEEKEEEEGKVQNKQMGGMFDIKIDVVVPTDADKGMKEIVEAKIAMMNQQKELAMMADKDDSAAGKEGRKGSGGEKKEAEEEDEEEVVVEIQQRGGFSAYQGRGFSAEEIDQAIYDFEPWVEITQRFESEVELIDDVVASLTGSSSAAAEVAGNVFPPVVAWFQGRSEFGQRALGSRSFLADPRRTDVRKYINQVVKQREWYRPLAPSVLDEYVGDWFEGMKSGANSSPFMSFTAAFKSEKVAEVPAVAHIDNTARLQTVTYSDNPLYHALITAFYKATGVPMVLNTSFNRKGQPIVETPTAALKAFVDCQGAVQYLYIGMNKIRIKPFPFPSASSSAARAAAIHSVGSSRDDEEMDSDEALMQRLSDVFIYGTPVYLSETTTSFSSSPPSAAATAVQGSSGMMPAGAAKPVRVRIQDGGIRATDNLMVWDGSASTGSTGATLEEEAAATAAAAVEEEQRADQWRELPSELHLEILQLLVESPISDVGSESDTDTDSDRESILKQMLSAGVEQEIDAEEQARIAQAIKESYKPRNDLSVAELFEALQQLHYDYDAEGEGEKDEAGAGGGGVGKSTIEWETVRDALEWLYSNNLVFFDDPNSVNADPKNLFQMGDVVDLRGFT